MKRPKPKARLWALQTKAVEEGVDYGYRRAHKHTDEPTEEQMKAAIIDAVQLSLFEVFDYD